MANEEKSANQIYLQRNHCAPPSMATFPRRRRQVIEESSDDSDGEGSFGQETDAVEDSTKKKKKTAGKMFMTAVESMLGVPLVFLPVYRRLSKLNKQI